MMWWWHGSTWGWLAMTIAMLAFWGLVVWAIVTVARSQRPSTPTSGAEAALAGRFALGEIDEDEYRARLATLRGTTGAPARRSSRAAP